MIFLLLGEGLNDDISESVAKEEKAEKNLVFTKTNTKLSLSLYYTGGKSYLYVLSLYYTCDESYLYVNKTEIYKFKTHDNVPWYEFSLEETSKEFAKDELSEISLNGAVYDISVDHYAIEKKDILNIHEYLMKRNNIK